MRDPGDEIRFAFVAALAAANPNIGGIAVPVVDGKLDQELLPTWEYYIVVTNQTADVRTNKNRAAQVETVILDIHHITQTTVAKDRVESIADQILNYIFPTSTDPGDFCAELKSLNSPFNVTYCKVGPMETPAPVKLDGNRFLQRKILTFNNRITSN